MNQLKPVVSVIIPVYNQEKYLRECLDSVCNQSLQNIEVICVNDGSTDNSKEILGIYAKRDSRIRILSQKNQGAGAARNLGMQIAKGKYLSFLDSDDIFEPLMLETMVRAIEKDNADVLVCRSDRFDTNTGIRESMPWSIRKDLLPNFIPFNSGDVKKNFFELFVWWPWDKLYRKDYIDKIGIQFQELRTTNDLFFVCTSILIADRVSVISDILIHQRTNLKTSLSSTREKSWGNYLEALDALKEFLTKHHIYEKYERDFVNYCLNFSLWHLDTITGHSYSLLYNALKEIWLKRFGILNHTENYFYNINNYARIAVILNNSPEDILFSKIVQLEKENEQLRYDYEKIEHSLSFKIGRLITAFPRKLRDGMKNG